MTRRCFCPDDCGCHYPHRANVCGCRGHQPPDVEYADEDEVGQLGLGVPGEQRAIPSLAPMPAYQPLPDDFYDYDESL